MSEPGIFVGLGANLPSPAGPPLVTCATALARLSAMGVTVIARSRWYRSAPVPPSDQPWFVNGVARVAWPGPPERLLDALHAVEQSLGRVRRVRDEARAIDLDLLAFDGLTRDTPPILPHPRLHERAFVLRPMAELAPGWRHPRLGLAIKALIALLPPGQRVEPIPATLAHEATDTI
ncbi:MAG: 2-amino-4-hydroxy-6-hydroxymethyldihydropteridine diphosphokinase [Alphaproteobacteria bacterium]